MFLNCHSYHSLRYGTIPLDNLIQMATDYGIRILGLTDINTVSGIYDFTKKCKENGIKPIVGIDFRNNNQRLYVGIAQNTKGIAELCRFLTDHNLEKKPLPQRAPVFENAMIIYPLTNVPGRLANGEFLGVRSEDVTKLIRPQFRELLNKAVVFESVTIRNRKEHELHKILRCIDQNILLSQLPEGSYCSPLEMMSPPDSVTKKFQHYPGILENTRNLIDKCGFNFDFDVPRNKKYYTGSKQGDTLLLQQLTDDGLLNRYGKNNETAIARAQKELKIINQLNFTGYFLITWDIIRYSQSRGFMHVGRGSGANSIISYCLGITDICPIELDLYFERFLNPNRKSPPDFDIDWSWRDRDIILDYIFKRFSPGHVAFCCTIVSFKPRSILREIGKVYGLQKSELDQLTRSGDASGGADSTISEIKEFGQMLLGFPNQRSMHSCGVLISEEPITNFAALEIKPKGYPIAQLDMHIAEEIGYEKFDILSQRGLGTIASSVDLIVSNRGIKVDIKDVSLSKNEARCNSYLQVGNTLGCFYIESPAMRGLLRRLKCDNYKTLVAASSVIRPAVAQSGMMQEYVFRHNHPDKFEYVHQVFEEYLKDTYGVMVYQEDVIKVAQYYAGLDPAYGDILRRSISGKTRSPEEIEKIKKNFFESCKKNDRPEELSAEVYRQIKSFAGYSFCKAHSASYAVESYQSLYLKAHFGIEFMVAAINNGGGFYRTEIYVHEAKRAGATIHNPCINLSNGETCVYGTDVYLGLNLVKGIASELRDEIVFERTLHGKFGSLENFISRTNIGIETLQTLIFVGAFRFTGKTKSELIIISKMLDLETVPKNAPLLLEEPAQEYKFPTIDRNTIEDAFDEIEILGFPVSCSPFQLLKTKFRGSVMTKDLLANYKKTVKMLAYLVSTKQVPTKHGDMFFGTWIDYNGDYFDTAHFANSLKKYPFKGGGCYLLLGRVEVDYHFPTVIISKMEKMPFLPDPRYSNREKGRYEVYKKIREDRSLTHRAPYPQENEIGLPRRKMARPPN